MDDADHPVLDDERDRDDGVDATLPQHRAVRARSPTGRGPAAVGGWRRRGPPCRHRADRDRPPDLLLQPDRRPHVQVPSARRAGSPRCPPASTSTMRPSSASRGRSARGARARPPRRARASAASRRLPPQLGARLPLALQKLCSLFLRALAPHELAELCADRASGCARAPDRAAAGPAEGLEHADHLALDQHRERDAGAKPLGRRDGGASEPCRLELLEPLRGCPRPPRVRGASRARGSGAPSSRENRRAAGLVAPRRPGARRARSTRRMRRPSRGSRRSLPAGAAPLPRRSPHCRARP